MPRVLLVAIVLFLLVYCLFDTIRADDARIRTLPKALWLLLVIFLPIAGPVAWLVAGRPGPVFLTATPTGGTAHPHPGGVVRAPDDDPAFLASLRQNDAEHEELLRLWEADLKRREEDLRQGRQPESGGAPQLSDEDLRRTEEELRRTEDIDPDQP